MALYGGACGGNEGPVGGVGCGVGGGFTSTAAILVLFILLVIISKTFLI
ncbi:sporulation protein YjcZ [Paenibacillus monticola]|nr:sporulation protein YjcZ [Paenibacillus monticola]